MSELRAAGELAALGFRGATSRVEEMHLAIARRATAGTSQSAIARGVYATVRTLGGAVVQAIATGAGAFAQEDRLSLSRGGSFAIGALNGLLGDRLEEDGSPLSVEMGLWHGGRPLPVEPDALAAAFPTAPTRLAVFVHGLCETEDAWRIGAERHGSTYGARLHAELGFAPLYVRYNTGLSMADNGRRLSRLLTGVMSAWPGLVERIVLIGHSMGGLVIRCACDEDAPWCAAVTNVVYLGAPHSGADLARAARAAGAGLRRFPETSTFATILETRSAGIRDLERALDLPALESAEHHCVTASLDGLPGTMLGDLLVRRGGGSWADSGASCRHYGGLNHFQLLNHPDVYDQLRAWLERT